MRFATIIFLVFTLGSSCTIDREIKETDTIEEIALERFKNLPEKNKVKLVGDKEPGQKLYICGTLVHEKDSIIIPRAEILFYHTDVEGEYRESIKGEESTARISGRLVTDDVGQFFVETILPGDYPRRKDNRHIHTLVRGARPEAYDIHFRQFTDYLAAEFIRGSDQHFNVYLKQTSSGEFVAFVKLAAKRYKN